MIKCRITERRFPDGGLGYRVEYKPGLFFWEYDSIYFSLALAKAAVERIKTTGSPSGERVIYCE